MAKIACIKYVRIYIILLTYLHIPLMSQNSISQVIRQQQQQSKISVLNDFSSNRQSNSKQQLKTKALQTAVGANQQPTSSGITAAAAIAAQSAVGNGLPGADDQYKCAKHCTCSIIQVLERAKGQIKANLTQAKCESSLFSDVLTIDRRTQIIHISLPISDLKTTSLQNVDTFSAKTNNEQRIRNNLQSFRMPRLVQFNNLKEIIIINLRFEVCDSEVFKRGQSLRRFKLNYNKLMRISKACLKHLEKLVELNLDYNNLEELESALFSSLLSLKSLSIAHNKLSELAAHQFVNLTNLISLNLVGNSFKTINLHLFEPMQNNLRLLLLAKNEIKLFVYSPIQQQNQTPNPVQLSNNNQTKLAQNWSSPSIIPLQLPLQIPVLTATKSSALLSGVVFKNLIKLNVDHNKLERIKQLQLHRFFNIKYLSIRHNNIATIRDKAFNGLKLIELNLAHNQLASISKCAFCNATIKRLVLSHNNITLPLTSQMLLEPPTSVLSSSSSIVAASASEIPRPLASVATNEIYLPEPLAQKSSFSSPDQPASPSNNPAPSASSSQNMLILSQSIFGPLFGQLEYLDLSNNEMLANQLDLLLEPLLKLEYLNIAAVGLDRSLTSPTLFKNLRQLKYLNISNNQLDMLVSETVEPLTMLEVLDMSNNKFSELDESFLVTIDELSSLKVVNFGSNPWFCSQCKVAPLYDWISRSQIYNYTCIAPLFELQQEENNNDNNEMDVNSLLGDNLDNNQQATSNEQSMFNSNNQIYKSVHDYNILLSDEVADELETSIDFDSVLSPSLDDDSISNYNFLDSSLSLNSGQSLMRSDLLTITSEDDPSITQTIAKTSMIINPNSLSKRFNPIDYCLRCEFPRELHKFKIHELNPGDFKFCADGAPRFAASEPRIGLTLAIVIIGALFLIIIVVIVMYRRKSNTYYTNEDTDALNGAKKPVLSISSDVEHQYGGDGTDYSSPPMSQSYDSYSQDDDDDEEEDEEEEDEDEEIEDEDDEEYDEEDDNNGGEEVGDELDEQESGAGKERKGNEGNRPDETTRFSLGSSKSEDQHHKQTSEQHNKKQIRQASLIAGSPNELRPSSALTPSSERTTKGIRDKSQSSIQSNSAASKRIQQVTVEKASWAPNSASNSSNLTGGAVNSTEHSGKSEKLVEKLGAESVARKLASSRQSSGGRASKMNKLLSNQSAESQSSYSNGGQQQQQQRQKHLQQKTRETDLAQKFKETQSGSLSLPKRYSNKGTTPSDSLERETREGRDSWSTSQANNSDHLDQEKSSPDINVVARLRAKRNSGCIYQVATSLKPLNLSSSKSSNRSSNGTGRDDSRSATTYSSHLGDNYNNTNEMSNNQSKNKSLQAKNHSAAKRSDSQASPYLAGTSRQHTTGAATSNGAANSPRPTMSRQRFAAISNDIADGLAREETLANNPIRDMSMIITPKQAEHLVREANAFQQINPADESSISSALPPLPAASDFMQALQANEPLKGGKNFTPNRNEINNQQHYGMAHQERVQSPSPASDATTADSLAMEALEYLANELDDNELLSTHPVVAAAASSSGAAASATTNKEFLTLDETGGALAELDASSLEYDAHNMIQHLTAPGAGNGKGLKKLHESHSTHSALTQTGSRELGDI